MNYTRRLTPFLTLLFAAACTQPPQSDQTAPSVPTVPAHVQVRNDVDGDGYSLYVNNEPFDAKGVGLSYREGRNFMQLKEAGANTFRTWSSQNGDEVMAAAAENGMMVAMGLSMGKQLHGFDYNDTEAVAEQFARIKEAVNAYKDHPNLLAWVAGNELNLLFDEAGQLKLVDPGVYVALADIVDYIHEVDPNHPVTTTFAGITKSHIELTLEHAPQLDFLSYQVYGDLLVIGELVESTGVDRPYMITEYGPRGHWEMPSTSWGREIEEPSGIKARGFADRIQKGIMDDTSGLQLGSFAFLWGQKQERTPTWYGMFHKTGEATARVDELTKLWTGSYPENQAPDVRAITLDGKEPAENIFLKPGNRYSASIDVSDPDGNELITEWLVMKEVDVRSEGGASEQEPDVVAVEILSSSADAVTFVAPSTVGDYRLFAYVYEVDEETGLARRATSEATGGLDTAKAGDANAPFFVQE